MLNNKQELQEAIAKYEDMMAELQPHLWQRDALLKEIKEAIVAQKATVITDGFIYACQGHVGYCYARYRDQQGRSYLPVPYYGETTAWSKIKIPSTVKEMFTVEKPGKMKVEIK